MVCGKKSKVVMKSTRLISAAAGQWSKAIIVSLFVVICCVLQAGPIATNPPGFKIIKPQTGGLSPLVEVGSITCQGTNVILDIGGLRGPYSVEKKSDKVL